MVSYKKLDNIYLPDALYQSLIAYQKQRGFGETSDAIVAILAQFFDKSDEIKRYATVEQMEELERKVSHLSQQVTQLCQIMASSAQSETASTVFAGSNAYAFESTDFDEVEDEPDEILSDFLEPGSSSSPSR
jgi:hypothetical protein